MQRRPCGVHRRWDPTHDRQARGARATPDELQRLIREGEGSGLEFNRDEVTNFDLAQEVTALLNHSGGVVLLGVDDDGRIVGAQGRAWRSGWPSFVAPRPIRSSKSRKHVVCGRRTGRAATPLEPGILQGQRHGQPATLM